jgi:hypothetical protein
MEVRAQVIPAAVTSQIAALLERGYRIEHYQYDPAHFGNVIIDLKSDDIRLRLVRDRNEWLASLARSDAPEEDYFDFDTVLAALKIEPTGRPPASLAVLVSRLVSAAEQWEKLFSQEEYESACRSFRTIEQHAARIRYGYDPDSSDVN